MKLVTTMPTCSTKPCLPSRTVACLGEFATTNSPYCPLPSVPHYVGPTASTPWLNGVRPALKRCASASRCRRNPETGLYETPSEPAIRRFIQAVDAEAVDATVSGWVRSTVERGLVASIDGKTVRGARTHNGQVKLLSAFLPLEGAVLSQQEIPPTTNEITVVKALLDPVPLEGVVVTADAMHTQKETAAYLVEEKKADYVFTVKNNQPSLREAIQDLNLVDFPPSAPDFR